MLPVQKAPVTAAAKSTTDFIFQPDKESLLLELAPKILKTQLYKAVLDSNASEHGARLTAMDKATNNAQDLLRQLSISYNRARQASITNEILEVVSGANALSAS
jgi:F-type H+-transporting ATPase subunit gamma